MKWKFKNALIRTNSTSVPLGSWFFFFVLLPDFFEKKRVFARRGMLQGTTG
jgi:hypothetical protein